MAIASIGCPKCAQTFRSTDDVKGTRIRCPLCGAAFVVKKFTLEDEPRLADPKGKRSDDGDEDNPNPYGVTDVRITSRCPNCANEMESENAVVCVHCGYNTQTRTVGKTVKVVEQTRADAFKWLGPGIGCAVGILILVLLQNYYVLEMSVGNKVSDAWFTSLIYSEAVFIWATIMLLGVIWKLGQFAYKRLIVEPVPPEEAAD